MVNTWKTSEDFDGKNQRFNTSGDSFTFLSPLYNNHPLFHLTKKDLLLEKSTAASVFKRRGAGGGEAGGEARKQEEDKG